MSKRETGYVTVTTKEMADPYCKLCSSKDDPPIDARSIGFYTRQEQNIFTLDLCQGHRIDLLRVIISTLEVEMVLMAGDSIKGLGDGGA